MPSPSSVAGLDVPGTVSGRRRRARMSRGASGPACRPYRLAPVPGGRPNAAAAAVRGGGRPRAGAGVLRRDGFRAGDRAVGGSVVRARHRMAGSTRAATHPPIHRGSRLQLHGRRRQAAPCARSGSAGAPDVRRSRRPLVPGTQAGRPPRRLGLASRPGRARDVLRRARPPVFGAGIRIRCIRVERFRARPPSRSGTSRTWRCTWRPSGVRSTATIGSATRLAEYRRMLNAVLRRDPSRRPEGRRRGGRHGALRRSCTRISPAAPASACSPRASCASSSRGRCTSTSSITTRTRSVGRSGRP